MPSLLEVSHLSVGYGWDHDSTLTAVKAVDLRVEAGEVYGIAGESGCGKSTLVQAVTGLLEPPGRILEGSVRFDGRDVLALSKEDLRRLRLQEVSMVFQASMNVLNPVTRIREQFADAMAAHGVTDRAEAHGRAEAMFELVKVPPRFLDAYPHQLSGGMRQRAVIALCLVLRPRLIFLDEPTTALDVVVQRSILQSVNDLRREFGFAMVFITHDLSLLVEIADRIAIMYAGEVVEEAPARALYERPRHPYTKALMRSFPPLGGAKDRLEGIGGQPPDLRHMPPGCAFAPRCAERVNGRCDVRAPALMDLGGDHRVACHRHGPEGGAGHGG